MKMSLEEMREHISGIATEDMLRFARDEVFEDLHYIFVNCTGKNKTRKRMAHCTHCGHDFDGGGLLHKERVVCPNCNFRSRVYYAWYSRENCVEYGSMLYWQKSPADGNAVTAVMLNLRLDMGGSVALAGVPAVETKLAEMFVFIHGKGSARYSLGWSGWYKTESVRNPLTQIPSRIAEYSFHESVSGTNFERMGVRDFDICYSIECMDMAARWPSFEYINKLGFKELLKDKMIGRQTFGAVNWNGKTLFSVLGLTKEDIKEIRNSKTQVEYRALYVLRKMRKEGDKVTITEAMKMSERLDCFAKADLDKMFRQGNINRVVEYYRKQTNIKGENGRNRYYSDYNVHRDYEDYVSQCAQLGLDLSDTAIRWPADLYQAHQNLTTQIEYKKNADLDKNVKMRAEKLRNYAFRWGEIVMHPFTSSKEIIDEGAALNHCVGGYVKRYADGGTILCALRRVDAPDTPWHTVEFTNDGRLVQCRGLRNMTAEEEKPLLDAFWAAFEEHRTKKVRKSA